MLRHLSCVVVIIGCVLGLGVTSALAHGPIRHGLEIDHNTQLKLATGENGGSWRWVTVGFRPGPVHIGLTLDYCSHPIAPTCAVFVNLRTPAGSVQTSEVACLRSHRKCRQSTQLTYTIPRARLYYVVVGAQGGEGVHYTLSVRGNIYTLGCRKYC